MRPLPNRDVEAHIGRTGPARLSSAQVKVLRGVEDPELQKALGELLGSTAATQENFEEIEQWFPVTAAASASLGPGLRYRYCGNAPLNEGTKEGPGNFFLETGGVGTKGNIYVTIKDLEAKKVEKYLATWDDSTTTGSRGYVFITQSGHSGVLVIVKITGAAVLKEPAGQEKYFKIPVETLAIGEVPENFDETIELTFYRTGDQGEAGVEGKEGKEGKEGPAGKEGLAGAAGAAGAAGRAAGLNYKWLTNTEATDPGAGKLKTNAGKTLLRISETDGDGNAIAALIATWDDSSSAKRGTLLIRQVSNPKRFIEFAITGANVDEGAYDKLAVEVIVEGEAIENEAEVRVEFSRTGDKGDEGKEGKEGPAGKEGGGSAEHDKGIVHHGAEGATARPEGHESIEWHGTAEPVNAIDGDTWIKL